MQLKLRSYLYIRKKHKSHFCSSLFVSSSINQDDADMSLWTNVNSVDDIWQQQPVDCCHQHQHYREDIKKRHTVAMHKGSLVTSTDQKATKCV